MGETEILSEWLKLATSDLNASRYLLSQEELLLSAYHMQQSIEKMLKRYYIFSKKEQPPYIHNLLELANRCGLMSEMKEDQIDLLTALNPFYIRSRYPAYKKTLEDKLELKKVESLKKLTDEVFQWLNQKTN